MSVVRCNDNQFLSAFSDSFAQYAADNVDHNAHTLDGVNTFHDVRIISLSTSCSADLFKTYNFSAVPIPRIARVNVATIVRNRGIPLLSYEIPDKSALSVLHLKQWNCLALLIEKNFLS